MKEITIQIPEGKKAEWIDGVLTLVDEADNRPVTERIKTFEDACNALGDKHPLVRQYAAVYDTLNDNDVCFGNFKDTIAYMKLRIIVAALNEDWVPKFEKGENCYYPWFYLYTKAEYDKLDENEKGRCVLRSGYRTFAFSGSVDVNAFDDASYSYTYSGSRLAFKTRELAIYAGKQFIEEWADFMFKTKE